MCMYIYILSYPSMCHTQKTPNHVLPLFFFAKNAYNIYLFGILQGFFLPASLFWCRKELTHTNTIPLSRNPLWIRSEINTVAPIRPGSSVGDMKSHRGKGFISWFSCKKLPAERLPQRQAECEDESRCRRLSRVRGCGDWAKKMPRAAEQSK